MTVSLPEVAEKRSLSLKRKKGREKGTCPHSYGRVKPVAWAHPLGGRQEQRWVSTGHLHEYLTLVCLGEGLIELPRNVK